MKLIFWEVILLILFTSNLFAQDKINVTGKVIDNEKQAPLVGAQVFIEDGIGTLTDNNGYFNLILTEGDYTLTVSYLGYERVEIELHTDNPNVGEIAMPVSRTSLNEIIVSASLQNYRDDFKGANYRISPKAIKNINPLSTEEVLRTVPGLNIVGDMGLSNRPNISMRGSWGRRSKKVLLMEDGSPSAPAPYVAPGAYYNPVSDRIKAIEVYQGADMLRYGPNNMYGAVNYITALPPQKTELRMKLIGGQRNYKTALLSYGGTWNNLGALVEGVYKKFDGFTDNSSVEVLNLNAKIFAKLSDDQSLYFKVSGQFEDNQASLSSQTPFTFENDPTQNPFDADRFTMRRYGVDIIHKWLPTSNISLTSKIYASDFERDWWKQVTTKVKASEVESYVGDQIFNDRYSYLRGLIFSEDDYVRVGRITNGRESTTDSRWAFTVSGIKETFNISWGNTDQPHELEVGFKLHQESYKDRSLAADSSRWARSGYTTADLKYYLWSASGYIRNEFNLNKFGITPIVRFEHIDMYRQNMLSLRYDPDITGLEDGREYNVYDVLMPGITLDYEIPSGEIFGSIYQGFIAPSKVFGFLVEQDGVVTNPLAGESINIQPELSINTEIGWRGILLKDRIDGQLTYFNNTIRNFYAGGRNEVFSELGKFHIQGIEAGLNVSLFETGDQALRWYGNVTLLKSDIISGKLTDKDLFSQVTHNDATISEFIKKVNANRNAYEIYVSDGNGGEALLTDESLTKEDFQSITSSTLQFGKNGIDNADAPYSPKVNFNTGFNYDYKRLSLGLSAQYVGEQFSEFHNFSNESADGAIGKIPSYFIMDAFANYNIILKGKTNLNVFINAKNLTNNIYRASRLNRATSGIFPGGFRQIIAGINLTI